MKNKAVKTWGILAFFMAMAVVSVMAAEKAKDVVGTWSYEAPSAPYEYAKGQLIFTENDSKLEGKIKIGNSEIAMRDLKHDGETVSFGAYVEGEYVSLKLTVKGKAFTGKASYSEGTIDVKGTKE